MEEPLSLTVAFVPGVTVTKWTRTWAQRHPEVPLIVTPTAENDQVAVLQDGRAQLSFVRQPIDSDGLHVIPLYREAPVVVAEKDHPISAVDAVTLADLAEEKLLVDEPARTLRDTFDLIAAGVGIVVVPQSIARLQSRKDVVARPVTDAPDTQISLAWRVESEGESALAEGLRELIEEFIGIVRGRTARSSRATAQGEADGAPPDPSPAKGMARAKGAKSKGAKSNGAGPTKGAKSKSAGQAKNAAHATNRKRAAARKKHRGR